MWNKKALNHFCHSDQMWQLCITFDYTQPTPPTHQRKKGNMSLQLQSFNKDNSKGKHKRADEGWERYDVALIFPGGGIYHILFNNAKSFKGQSQTSQPFRKEFRGLSRHWTVTKLSGWRKREGGERCLQQDWWRDNREDGQESERTDRIWSVSSQGDMGKVKSWRDGAERVNLFRCGPREAGAEI